MKHFNYIVLFCFVFLIFGLSKIYAQDANTLLINMDKVLFSAKDKQGKVTIILTDKSGKQSVREASMMQKGNDKKLYRYTKPENQAGIATLSLANGVMWLYMPAFEKPKKISLLAKSQAFTGTDFSYEDMANDSYSDRYTATILETGSDYYQLQLTPKNDKSSYGKIIVKINKTAFYPIKIDYFNGKGKKFKEATYVYEMVGKYWNASEVVMMDLEKNHSTTIHLSEMKFDQGIADDQFTVEKLKL